MTQGFHHDQRLAQDLVHPERVGAWPDVIQQRGEGGGERRRRVPGENPPQGQHGHQILAAAQNALAQAGLHAVARHFQRPVDGGDRHGEDTARGPAQEGAGHGYRWRQVHHQAGPDTHLGSDDQVAAQFLHPHPDHIHADAAAGDLGRAGRGREAGDGDQHQRLLVRQARRRLARQEAAFRRRRPPG